MQHPCDRALTSSTPVLTRAAYSLDPRTDTPARNELGFLTTAVRRPSENRSSLVVISLGLSLSAGLSCVESRSADVAPPAATTAASTLSRLIAPDTPEQELARRVEALLVGPQGSCENCHSITRQVVRDWAAAMRSVETSCFDAPGLTPAQRVDCLRADPSSPDSPFSVRKLGLYATGVGSPQFAQLFVDAFGPERGPSRHATFVSEAGMPLGGPAFSADDFEAVKAWVLSGTPAIESVFDGGIAPDAACDEAATATALLDHVARMKVEGWGARLADLATPMFGCGEGQAPLGCLASRPDVTTSFGGPSAAQTVRLLYAHNAESVFWVRSSADGRYLGYSLASFRGSRVVDLTRPDDLIEVGALFDPYFFPSNDGFSFGGAGDAVATRVCRQSLLADAMGMPSRSISMAEPECSTATSADYQSIGSSLDGVRYFMTIGTHQNDPGGYPPATAPLPTPFGQGASTQFLPMVNDGQAYQVGSPVTVNLPGEGDAILSPSGRLMSTRFERANGQSAYRVRLVKAEGTGSSLSIETPLMTQVCSPGAKASFSFDERFLVTHQYVDPDDPAQASLPPGSSNILLVDLMTGLKTRLTQMPRGRFALFPHFRADGWLYFLVRDMNEHQEYFLATDAALRISG